MDLKEPITTQEQLDKILKGRLEREHKDLRAIGQKLCFKTNKRKKEVIRMVIDNSESKFSDADLTKAIQGVTNEFGANYTIACFTKTGELVNVYK